VTICALFSWINASTFIFLYVFWMQIVKSFVQDWLFYIAILLNTSFSDIQSRAKTVIISITKA